MKRFVALLVFLLLFVCVYNADTLLRYFRATIADQAYDRGNMTQAQKRYSDIAGSGNDLLESHILYNLGNTLYRLWEKEEGPGQQTLWKESLYAYSGSLLRKKDEMTESNYTFVLNKLEELEKKEQQESADSDEKNAGAGDRNSSSESGSWSQSGSGQSRTQTGEVKKGTNDGKTWNNAWGYNSVWWQDAFGSGSTLSESEVQELRKYMDQIKEFQRQNSSLFNAESGASRPGTYDDLKDLFRNDSFFDQTIPGNGEKKDW